MLVTAQYASDECTIQHTNGKPMSGKLVALVNEFNAGKILKTEKTEISYSIVEEI